MDLYRAPCRPSRHRTGSKTPEGPKGNSSQIDRKPIETSLFRLFFVPFMAFSMPLFKLSLTEKAPGNEEQRLSEDESFSDGESLSPMELEL